MSFGVATYAGDGCFVYSLLFNWHWQPFVDEFDEADAGVIIEFYGGMVNYVPVYPFYGVTRDSIFVE